MKIMDKILGLSRRLAIEIKNFQKNTITAGELTEFLVEFNDYIEYAIVVIRPKKGVSL